MVRAKEVAERYINRLLIKVGGMSRHRAPRAIEPKTPFTFSLGKPFLTTDDGPAILIRIAQAMPLGFRHPSKKAKKWTSTSLLEKVCGVKPQFVGSTRRQRTAESFEDFRARMAQERADYLANVRHTQNDRNVDPKFLNAGARRRVAAQPDLPDKLAA